MLNPMRIFTAWKVVIKKYFEVLDMWKTKPPQTWEDIKNAYKYILSCGASELSGVGVK